VSGVWRRHHETCECRPGGTVDVRLHHAVCRAVRRVDADTQSHPRWLLSTHADTHPRGDPRPVAGPRHGSSRLPSLRSPRPARTCPVPFREDSGGKPPAGTHSPD
jgi:hypothetical protein